MGGTGGSDSRGFPRGSLIWSSSVISGRGTTGPIDVSELLVSGTGIRRRT